MAMYMNNVEEQLVKKPVVVWCWVDKSECCGALDS